MRTVLISLALATGLSGCAEMFLEQELRTIEGQTRRLDVYNDMLTLSCPGGTPPCAVSGAIRLAFDQADAYARAARHSQTTQDLAYAALLGTAGWTALGAVNGIPGAVQAERAVAAVAVQQTGRRSVPRSAVQALYQGASRMNCIALAGSLYQEIEVDAGSAAPADSIPPQLASFIMVLSMREVEYRTLNGNARELDEFSTLVQAYRSVVEATETEQVTTQEETSRSMFGQSDRTVTTTRVIQRNAELERFYGVLRGCLESGAPAPDVTATATTP